MIFPVKRLADLGFEIVATGRHRRGAAPARHRRARSSASTATELGGGRDAVSLIAAGEVALVINTPQGSGASAGRRVRDPQRRGHRRTSRASPRSPGGGRGDGHRGADPGRDVGTPAAGAARPCAVPWPGHGGAVGPTGERDLRAALRPALFRIGGGDAEAAHEWTPAAVGGGSGAGARRRCGRWYAVRRRDRCSGWVPQPGRAGRRHGQGRPGPAGLAGAGFGFVEVGTVTAHAQPGNPGPGCSACRPASA